MSVALLAKLAVVRRRAVTVAVVDGGCVIVLYLLAGLVTIMLLDYWIELPWLMRAVLLAGLVGWLGVLLVRRVLLPAWRVPDDDELALQVQRRMPSLGSRLIAAVQLSNAVPAGASVSLIRAHIEHTERLAAPLDFSIAVPTLRVRRLSIATGSAIIIGILFLVVSGADGRDLLLRALLVPGIDVPRRTHVKLITPNPLVIGKGESVELRARAIGVVPSEGSAALDYSGEHGGDHDAVQIRLDAVTAKPGENPSDEFTATVSAVTQSFSYRIRLNDGQSARAQVRAAVRPAITSLEIQQHFPSYTHLDPIRRMPNDLRLLAGSRLSLHAMVSSPLHPLATEVHDSSRLLFHCKSGDIERPLMPGGDHLQELSSGDPIDVPNDAQGMSVIAIDADGLASADPVVYPITILPDLPPTVSVTYPLKREQLSTAMAQLIVGVDARDDFALGNVRLCYRVLAPDAQPPDNIDAPPSGTIDFKMTGTPSELRGRFPFQLANLQPRPVVGGSVEWWLEARDTNDVTGPGIAASDHYLTRIASEAAVRADLYSQLAEHMSELKETADTQKKDNADLGALIQQETAP